MKANKLLKLNLREAKLPIFQNAYYWFIVPIAIIFIALVCGSVYVGANNKYDGFANVGIDFKGGTVLTVEMNGATMQGDNRDDNYQMIKDAVEANGGVVSSDQNSGTNSIIVRYPNSILVDGVRTDYNTADKTQDMIDINNRIIDQVTRDFKAKYGATVEIKANAEMLNATASSDLLKKAFLSVGIAMLLMLIYTAFRFDLFSGLAALLTQLNDIIVMLSLVIIFRIQINSSLIAGLITIVAYSINNTIVIFDRVRDNVKFARTKNPNATLDVKGIVNGSVSECLTRALFTSFTTLVTIVILASVGIKSLTDFALPIIFGIVSGLYSSLFLAPSIWGLMMNAKQKGAYKAKKAAAARGRRK